MTYISIPDEEKRHLFTLVKHALGAPVINVELEDEMMDSYLIMAIEEYNEHVSNWLIEQQWSHIYGKDLNSGDFSFYLMSRSLDFELSFSYAYSKQIGHGTNSPWELKKDFIELSANTQIYTIPAGRQVNSVLWSWEPPIDRGRLVAWNNMDWVASQYGWSIGGYPAAPINHIYNIVSSTQDVSIRNLINRGDFTYKITGGPNGTKNLFLYPVPGGRFDIRGSNWYELFTGVHHGINLSNNIVWYFYYDSEQLKDCNEDDFPDIVRVPSDFKLPNIKWAKLNQPTKIWIRKFLLAEAKMGLAKIYGKFSGKLKIPNDETTLDYNMFLTEGKEEKSKLIESLKEMLKNLDFATLIKKRADMSDDLMRIYQKVPFGQKSIIG
jgi:hypothetical protein